MKPGDAMKTDFYFFGRSNDGNLYLDYVGNREFEGENPDKCHNLPGEASLVFSRAIHHQHCRQTDSTKPDSYYVGNNPFFGLDLPQFIMEVIEERVI
jgi:hypothetical protein